MNVMNAFHSVGPWIMRYGPWMVLAIIPPIIIFLYFLKLRRQPIEVPSTYLWRRTIEDLHVNSLWQKLRQSLLLFLQLLIIFLVIMACLRPGFQGETLVGERFVFIIDTSASMNSTDVSPSRLEYAKQQALAHVDQMSSGNVAMVISVSDSSRVEQPFTSNRRALRRAIEGIKPTNNRSDISQALRSAAALANPGHTSDAADQTDQNIRIAEPKPASMYIFSDGGYETVPKFFLQNLTARYIPIGRSDANNVGIVGFTAQRNPEKPDQIQAFARLENPGQEMQTVDVILKFRGNLIDATSVEVPQRGAARVQFPLKSTGNQPGILELSIKQDDDFLTDNVAYAAINPTQKANVLFISEGNDPFKDALSTAGALDLAEVSYAFPAVLKSKTYTQKAQAGEYDLIIYDGCTPETLPQANTMFIGAVPKDAGWKAGKIEGPPFIYDTDQVHPLSQLVNMNLVDILDAFSVKPPAGGTVLFESDIGPLLSIAPRQGFEDAVLGFNLLRVTEDGDVEPNSNWQKKRSFPIFVLNMLKYLGGRSSAVALGADVKPGNPLRVRPLTPVQEASFRSPDGKQQTLLLEGQSTFYFTDTSQLGAYSVREGNSQDDTQYFTVNLFDNRESNIIPEAEIPIDDEVSIEASKTVERTRVELWKWILILAIIVLTFEWYVYNKRVYL